MEAKVNSVGGVWLTTPYGTRVLDAAREAVAAAAAAVPRTRRMAAESVQDLGRELAAVRRQLDALLARDSQLTQQKVLLEAALAKARQFAYRDELTGLPNRLLLLDRFEQAAARAARRHTQLAVLFLDLDGFKQVNDTLGHTGGDKLMQQVAARLLACIRTSDTVGRLGGDEFVVLLPELEDRDSALTAAAKIRARLAMPHVVDGTVLTITVSIGMAVCPADGEDYGELLRLADRAMYRDKARGAARSGSTVPRPERDAAL